MTDSYILRNLIKEKGFKLKYIAQKMGITYYTLQRKINNEVTFNSEEILKLWRIGFMSILCRSGSSGPRGYGRSVQKSSTASVHARISGA